MNDQLCGAGKFDSIDGHSFSGNWQGGILCAVFTVMCDLPRPVCRAGNDLVGEASAAYANGDRYTGEIRGLRRNGRGVLTYSTGASYTGEFLDDRRHGQGRFELKVSFRQLF